MSAFDKLCVVGLDADEMLGYFSLFTQLDYISNLLIRKESMKTFIRSFAKELWNSELIGKTRFFRPQISEFIQEIADAFHSGKIHRVFILSNNPSEFMLGVIAEVINFYADPEREKPDLIPETNIFGRNHPKRVGDKKSIYVIRDCLDMDGLRPENIIFFDDTEQACQWQGCRFVLVKKYEYATPVRAITNTFFAELRNFSTSLKPIESIGEELLGFITEVLESADSLAEKLIEHWREYPKDYMLRGVALSKDDDLFPGVNHEDLKDVCVSEHMLPALRDWLNRI